MWMEGVAAISFGSRSSMSKTLIVKSGLTAEKRPACVVLGSVISVEDGNQTTHEAKGRVRVLIIFSLCTPGQIRRIPCNTRRKPRRVGRSFSVARRAPSGRSGGYGARI